VNTVNQMGPGVTPSGHFGQHNNLQSLHHQHQMHHQQQLPLNNRPDSLYDSRLDDRNFVPDGMVPGLRQAAPPRSRESNGMFADPMDDPMQFNPHRLPPQQRGLDHSIFPSGAPSMYAQQGGLGRSTGMPLQQPQFRGNTPPNPLQGAQQRLPPGLANLGARPPHEPSQFIGSSHGMQQSSGIHGPVHGNGPSPQPFNNFNTNGGLGGFAGNPQMRGPPAHQIPNSLAHNQMGHPSSTMDIRGPTNQTQLLSLGGGPNIGGLRGAGGGFGPPGPPGQMQTPLLAMRQQQQQQQHLPPHMMPHPGHQIPPHLQQPVPPSSTQDLITLLMSGHT
jgi:zinc finger CCCH domain-containing protein 13